MSQKERVVIVGAGQAGGWVAKSLREYGYPGPISLVGNEPHPPYERPPLSKDVLLGEAKADSTYLWDRKHFEELEVDLRLGAEVIDVWREKQVVHLESGEALHYGKLVLTTGGTPRNLSVPRSDLENVNVLRDISDASKIRMSIENGGPIVVVGGGWIGLEVAASARKLGVAVTVVEAGDRLCSRAAPTALSKFLLELHKENGVTVLLSSKTTSLIGAEKVSGLQLSNGETLEADAVVVGIGIDPNTKIAKMSGLHVDDGIIVNELGRTSDKNIFAAGDVARHPNSYFGGNIRLESWENAQNQAISVAQTICGISTPYNCVPWFWSDQFDLNIQVIGFPDDRLEQVDRGPLGASGSVRFFLEDGIVKGAFAIDAARDIKITKRLVQHSIPVDPERLSDPGVKLQKLLA